MLNIFLDSKDAENCGYECVKCNDAWFDLFYLGKDFIITDEAARDIKIIDGSTYYKGTTMPTRFDEYISMAYLSTGCKTAMNVTMFTNICFSTIETGDQALLEILKKTDGNILPDMEPFSWDAFTMSAVIKYGGKEFRCNSYLEFNDIIRELK